MDALIVKFNEQNVYYQNNRRVSHSILGIEIYVTNIQKLHKLGYKFSGDQIAKYIDIVSKIGYSDYAKYLFDPYNGLQQSVTEIMLSDYNISYDQITGLCTYLYYNSNSSRYNWLDTIIDRGMVFTFSQVLTLIDLKCTLPLLRTGTYTLDQFREIMGHNIPPNIIGPFLERHPHIKPDAECINVYLTMFYKRSSTWTVSIDFSTMTNIYDALVLAGAHPDTQTLMIILKVSPKYSINISRLVDDGAILTPEVLTYAMQTVYRNYESCNYIISRSILPTIDDVHLMLEEIYCGTEDEVYNFVIVAINHIHPTIRTLELACFCQYTPLVKHIVNMGVTPSMSCLYMACRGNNKETFQYLIDYKLVPDIQCLHELSSHMSRFDNHVDMFIEFAARIFEAGLLCDDDAIEIILSKRISVGALSKYGIVYDDKLFQKYHRYMINLTDDDKRQFVIDKNVLKLYDMCKKRTGIDKIDMFIAKHSLKYDKYCLDYAYSRKHGCELADHILNQGVMPTTISLLYAHDVTVRLQIMNILDKN